MKNLIVKRVVLSLMGVGCLMPAASFASLNLVIDGSFEQPVVVAPFETYFAGQYVGTSPWHVTQGSIDVINGYWQPAPGSPGPQSVDAAGQVNGTIVQSISGLTIGTYYNLQFAMAGNPAGTPVIKTLLASFGSDSKTFTFDTTGHSLTDMGWVVESVIFKATATAEDLSFQDLSGVPSPFGSAIDNVSLTAVPEASTLVAGALMLLPFGVGAIRSLRKQRVV